MSRSIIHAGLDVHAQSIAVAIAQAGAEVRLQGNLSSDLHSVDKFLANLVQGAYRQTQTQIKAPKPSPKSHKSPIPTPTTPQPNLRQISRVKAFPTAEAHRRETPGQTL